MVSATRDLCCLLSLQRPLLVFEGECLSLWPRCYSGALMYGCFLCVSLCLFMSSCVCILTLCFCSRICLVLSFSFFFCLLSICVLCPGLTYLEIPTGASLS
jgi:hypothetical protein